MEDTEETTEKYCRHAECIVHTQSELRWLARSLGRMALLAAADAIPSAQVRCRIVPRKPHGGAPQAPLP